MGCGTAILKIILFVVNILVFLCGAAMFATSMWANLGPNAQNELDTLLNVTNAHDKNGTSIHVQLSDYETQLWIMVGIGAALLLIGFLGCCGALIESRLFLGVYMVLLLCLVVAQIVVAAFVLSTTNGVYDALGKGLGELTQQEQEQLQKKSECCGIKEGEVVDPYGTCTDDQKEGGSCFDKIWHFVQAFGLGIGAVALGLIVVQLVAVMFSCCLISAIGKNRYSTGI